MNRSSVFPTKMYAYVQHARPSRAHFTQSNGTANPHDHNIQCVLCFAVHVSLKKIFRSELIQ